MACSEITEVQVDLDNRTMKKLYSIPSEECSMVLFLGNAQRVTDNQTLAVWSDRGQMDIFDEEQQSVWKLNMGIGTAFGYGMWSENFGMR